MLVSLSTIALISSFPAQAGAGAVVAPVAILLLCVAAAVGTLLLLPSPLWAGWRALGGAVLAAAGLILVALVLRYTARLGQTSQHTIYFWIFSAVAVFSAVRVVTHRKPVYSALYFVLAVFASAGLFVLLQAEFMAAALVIIYAGAILITYVFVIMLAVQARSPDSATAAQRLADYDDNSRDPFVASAIGFTLMGVLLFVIFDRPELIDRAQTAGRPDRVRVMSGAPNVSGDTQELGIYLFNSQQFSLELAGLLLTVAMVGAIVIARRRVLRIGPHVPAAGPGEVITSPATPVNDDPHSIPVYGTDNPRQKAYPES